MDSKETLWIEKAYCVQHAMFDLINVLEALRTTTIRDEFALEVRALSFKHKPFDLHLTFSEYLNRRYIIPSRFRMTEKQRWDKFYDESRRHIRSEKKIILKKEDKDSLRKLLMLVNPNIESKKKESEIRFCLCSCFTLLYALFNLPDLDAYPRLDLKIMKTLFLTGQVIERLKKEGELRRDRPVKAGRTAKKSRYTDQDIIEAFYKCKAGNLNAMAVDIENLLTYLKKNFKSQKDVPSISTIKRVLKHEGLDKKLKK